MTKKEFLHRLEKGLKGIPKSELDERIEFYNEAIDDRIDEGLSESDAVADMGSIDDILKQILSEIPLSKLIYENVRPKRQMKPVETVLLILGFPVWFPLLISAAAVILSLFASLWSVIISFWVVFVSLIAYSIAALIAGIGITLSASTSVGLAVLSSGLISLGLSIFTFFGCKAISHGTVKLTKSLVFKFKSQFIKKGVA